MSLKSFITLATRLPPPLVIKLFLIFEEAIAERKQNTKEIKMPQKIVIALKVSLLNFMPFCLQNLLGPVQYFSPLNVYPGVVS
jgi:hypothetical protein